MTPRVPLPRFGVLLAAAQVCPWDSDWHSSPDGAPSPRHRTPATARGSCSPTAHVRLPLRFPSSLCPRRRLAGGHLWTNQPGAACLHASPGPQSALSNLTSPLGDDRLDTAPTGRPPHPHLASAQRAEGPFKGEKKPESRGEERGCSPAEIPRGSPRLENPHPLPWLQGVPTGSRSCLLPSPSLAPVNTPGLCVPQDLCTDCSFCLGGFRDCSLLLIILDWPETSPFPSMKAPPSAALSAHLSWPSGQWMAHSDGRVWG